VASKLPLFLPGGTFTMSATGFPTINDNILICGAGEDVTILDWSALGGGADYDAIRFGTFGIKAHFRDFTMLGTASATNACYAVKTDVTPDDGTKTITIALRNIEIDSFTRGIHSTALKHGLDLFIGECNIHDVYDYCANNWNDDTTTYIERKRVCVNSTFGPNSSSHLFYDHPNNECAWIGCTFKGSTDYAIQFQTTAGTTTGRHHLVSGCTFHPDCANYIVTANKNDQGKLVVQGCSFPNVNGGGIAVRSSLDFIGNRVSIDAGEFLATTAAGHYGVLLAHNQIDIYNQGSAQYVFNLIHDEVFGQIVHNHVNIDAGSDGETRVFAVASPGASTPMSRFIISENTIYSPSTTDNVIAIDVDGGQVEISRNNIYAPSKDDKGLIRLTGSPTAGSRLQIDGNTLEATGATNGNVWIGGDNTDSTGWAGLIYGRDNIFLGTGVFHNHDTSPESWYLQLGKGWGGQLASAATVWLDPSYDQYEITGTTTIDNINFGSNHANAEGAQFCMCGTVRFKVGAAFATSAAGNITPITTGARTAGEVIEFMYDPATQEWHEVN